MSDVSHSDYLPSSGILTGCLVRTLDAFMSDRPAAEGFAERLRLLKQPGESNERLAERLGVSVASLKSWMRKNPSEPGLASLIAISESAGISLDWLATGAVPENVPVETPDDHMQRAFAEACIPLVLRLVETIVAEGRGLASSEECKTAAEIALGLFREALASGFTITPEEASLRAFSYSSPQKRLTAREALQAAEGKMLHEASPDFTDPRDRGAAARPGRPRRS